MNNINNINNTNIMNETNNMNDTIIDTYKKNIFYNDISYVINVKDIKKSDLNIHNLFNSKFHKENIIKNNNISLKIENINSSYLLLYINNLYLLNKIDELLIITNLKNKKSVQIKNNNYFMLSNNIFYLLENCTLLLPISNKKELNKDSGIIYNYYTPLI